jgi:hypothetical protein
MAVMTRTQNPVNECNGGISTIIFRRVVTHVGMSLELRVLPLEAQLIRSALTSSVGPAIFGTWFRYLSPFS